MKYLIILLISFNMYSQSWYETKELVIDGTNIENPDWYPVPKIHFEKVKDSTTIYVTGYGTYGLGWTPSFTYWFDSQKEPYNLDNSGSIKYFWISSVTDKCVVERLAKLDFWNGIQNSDTLYVSLRNVNGPKTVKFHLGKKVKKKLKKFGKTK